MRVLTLERFGRWTRWTGIVALEPTIVAFTWASALPSM